MNNWIVLSEEIVLDLILFPDNVNPSIQEILKKWEGRLALSASCLPDIVRNIKNHKEGEKIDWRRVINQFKIIKTPSYIDIYCDLAQYNIGYYLTEASALCIDAEVLTSDEGFLNLSKVAISITQLSVREKQNLKIPFLPLAFTNKPYEEQFEKTYDQVISKGWYLLGTQLSNFEKEYAEINQVSYCIGLSNGLDALHLSLKALGVGKGDEVIVPSNTYIATALAVTYVGATPIFVEPDIRTYNIDPGLIEGKISNKTKAIIPVHLYGQACAMDDIIRIAEKYNLFVIEDNAQAHLATFNGQLTGSFGDINATSFYPGKNLGALGDAGAITTKSELYANKVSILRNYGSEKKYHNSHIGFNMRLDELQAGFLSVKLKDLQSATEKRKNIAAQFNELLNGIGDLILPEILVGATHVYHLYVIRTNQRDQLKQYLAENNIETLIHYPIPPHLQRAYRDLGYSTGDFPIAEELSNTSLSLPLWPGMDREMINYIIEKIIIFYE